MFYCDESLRWFFKPSVSFTKCCFSFSPLKEPLLKNGFLRMFCRIEITKVTYFHAALASPFEHSSPSTTTTTPLAVHNCPPTGVMLGTDACGQEGGSTVRAPPPRRKAEGSRWPRPRRHRGPRTGLNGTPGNDKPPSPCAPPRHSPPLLLACKFPPQSWRLSLQP